MACESKSMSWKTLKSSLKPRWTTESFDNSLWFLSLSNLEHYNCVSIRLSIVTMWFDRILIGAALIINSNGFLSSKVCNFTSPLSAGYLIFVQINGSYWPLFHYILTWLKIVSKKTRTYNLSLHIIGFLCGHRFSNRFSGLTPLRARRGTQEHVTYKYGKNRSQTQCWPFPSAVKVYLAPWSENYPDMVTPALQGVNPWSAVLFSTNK